MVKRKRLISATLAAIALFLAGCTTVVPSTTDDFSAAKRMVITFRDGEQLTGRFAEGQDVRYITFGRVYRATIEDIGPPDIILANAFVEGEYDRHTVQRERLEGSALRVEDGTGRILIPRYKITNVEEVTFDTAKTARNLLFWGFTGVITVLILNARL